VAPQVAVVAVTVRNLPTRHEVHMAGVAIVQVLQLEAAVHYVLQSIVAGGPTTVVVKTLASLQLVQTVALEHVLQPAVQVPVH
jgi:hypothetical protein